MWGRALVYSLLFALSADADHEAAAWRKLRGQARTLAKKAGERSAKLALIRQISDEDSARATKLLMSLAAPTVARRDELREKADKAARRFSKIDKQLRKKYGPNVSLYKLKENKFWRLRREAHRAALAKIQTGTHVLAAIGQACARVRTREAAAVLVDTADPVVAQARQSAAVRSGILACLWRQPFKHVVHQLVVFATDASGPRERMRVMHWIGSNKVKEGFKATAASLHAAESVVARTAVETLKQLDDPRAVPELISARKQAQGLLAEEIELALHYFTGKKFFGIGADTMWSGWWSSEGQAWLAKATKKRHDAAERRRASGAEFYGITTRSNRIVFVLDRSGSMAEKVPRRAPVSGSNTRDAPVHGRTKIEVARNQLARTIRRLPAGVKIAIIFFSSRAKEWQRPPTMVPATPENKRKGIAWFMQLEASGGTLLFNALHRALEYARPSKADPNGADTIFLLSDGAPTRRRGRSALKGDALEAAVAGFLIANRYHKCVVHTIGVGPRHNRSLMRRLAEETGGTYKAVGTE